MEKFKSSVHIVLRFLIGMCVLLPRLYNIHNYIIYNDIFGDSVKGKQNSLCHKYLTPDHVTLKLSSCLENSTNNMIPTQFTQ